MEYKKICVKKKFRELLLMVIYFRIIMFKQVITKCVIIINYKNPYVYIIKILFNREFSFNSFLILIFDYKIILY
jgi:hypothetical protein